MDFLKWVWLYFRHCKHSEHSSRILRLFATGLFCVCGDCASQFLGFHSFCSPDHILWTTKMIFLLVNSAESQLSAELKIFFQRWKIRVVFGLRRQKNLIFHEFLEKKIIIILSSMAMFLTFFIIFLTQ